MRRVEADMALVKASKGKSERNQTQQKKAEKDCSLMPECKQPCQQLEAKIADFIAGHADAATRREIQSHLDACPPCRRLVHSQQAVRQQLRLLAKRDKNLAPPALLWERAASAWDAQDARRRRGGQLRWVGAGACMLALLMGVVWANLSADRDFPVETVMRDFRSVRVAAPTPRFATNDADKAARWLRSRLNADLPPLNLSLSHAELLGADVVARSDSEQKIGRLLLRTSQGVMAIYVVPGGSRFARTTPLMIEDHDFQVKTTAADVGLYGWVSRDVGYGLLLAQPMGGGRGLAVNAEHASEQPNSGE